MHGIDAPYNSVAYTLVKFLDGKNMLIITIGLGSEVEVIICYTHKLFL
jgi:hypothetical protein